MQLKVGQGSGEFLQCPTFSEHVYNRIAAMLKVLVHKRKTPSSPLIGRLSLV